MSVFLYLLIGFCCSFIILWFSCDNRYVAPQVTDFGFITGVLAIPFWFIVMPVFILLKTVDYMCSFIERIKHKQGFMTIQNGEKYNIGIASSALGVSKIKKIDNAIGEKK